MLVNTFTDQIYCFTHARLMPKTSLYASFVIDHLAGHRSSENQSSHSQVNFNQL